MSCVLGTTIGLDLDVEEIVMQPAKAGTGT